MQHIIPATSTFVNPFHLYISPISLEKPLRAWEVSAQASVRRDLADSPLLRTYDHISGSQADELGDMYARAPYMPLRASGDRRSTLQTHIRNYEWKPTPYISFTSSPEALENFANLRKRNPCRRHQSILVIDPAVRIEAQRPVINFGEEMRYYDIKDPYDLPQKELDSHYICLWKVKADEVVGRWHWDELSSKPNWYEDIVLPAFRQFREKRRWEQVKEQMHNLSGALGALGCKYRQVTIL